jgi:hypothetical protein
MTADWNLLNTERRLRTLLIQTFPHAYAGERRDGVNIAVTRFTRIGAAERKRLIPQWSAAKSGLLSPRRG